MYYAFLLTMTFWLNNYSDSKYNYFTRIVDRKYYIYYIALIK